VAARVGLGARVTVGAFVGGVAAATSDASGPVSAGSPVAVLAGGAGVGEALNAGAFEPHAPRRLSDSAIASAGRPRGTGRRATRGTAQRAW
jgi:hypothetical protein